MKTIWNFLKSKFFWINVGAALLLAVIIICAVFFSLKKFTLHGENIVVPDLHGLYVEEAEVILKSQGLSYEVIDSVYMRDRLPGEIVEQVPDSNSNVKLGRKIYLTINSKSPLMVVLPDLRNFPARQAKATLEALGFRIEKIDYRPSEFPDLILDITENGVITRPGDKLRDGASLVLIVGERAIGEPAFTPDLKGMNIYLAEESIVAQRFIVGAVEYDETPIDDEDKLKFFVYRQTPEAGNSYETGRRIDLWLTKDEQKMSQSNDNSNNALEEDFFN